MPRTYNGYLSQSISFIVMTEEALKQEVVVWDEQQDVSTRVRNLIFREMKRRFFHGYIAEVQAWARSKAEEHRKKQREFDNIILVVRTSLKDQDHHLSLQKLSRHHGNIAERYSIVESTCVNF
jgi:exonuclease I